MDKPAFNSPPRGMTVPTWDGTRWEAAWVFDDGTTLPMRIADIGPMRYWAVEPASPDDLFFPFLDFMWPRVGAVPQAARALTAIEESLQRLAISIAKIDFFFERGEGQDVDFVETELEYIAAICRSVFDELHKVFLAIWEDTELLDPEAQRRKKARHPKETFAGVALDGDTPRDPAAIEHLWAIPPKIAKFYSDSARFFVPLRRWRNGFLHFGESRPSVLRLERGFAVWIDRMPFASMKIWKPHHMHATNIASLRPLMAHLVNSTTLACGEFAKAIRSTLRVGDEPGQSRNLYVRCRHSNALIRTLNVLDDASPWWRD